MHLIFKYDAAKDAENFLKSSMAMNRKKPTKLQRLYTEKYGTENNGDSHDFRLI
jgi:putative lipase involved disintegration of autophagic bodies